MPREKSSTGATPPSSQSSVLSMPTDKTDYLKEGLEGVQHLRYRSAAWFSNAIDKEIDKFAPDSAAQYVIFSAVSEEQLVEVDNICKIIRGTGSYSHSAEEFAKHVSHC